MEHEISRMPSTTDTKYNLFTGIRFDVDFKAQMHKMSGVSFKVTTLNKMPKWEWKA